MGKPLDQDHDHRISLPEAAEQARRARGGAKARPTDSGAFTAKAVRALLDQPGCVGLRYYKARNGKGDDTMVLVGVDEKGNDMTAGVLLNVVMFCPPYCPDDNDLNR